MEKRTKVALGCVAAVAGTCVFGFAGLAVLGLMVDPQPPREPMAPAQVVAEEPKAAPVVEERAAEPTPDPEPEPEPEPEPAYRINRDTMGCDTEESYDRMLAVARSGGNVFRAQGCTMIRDGTEVGFVRSNGFPPTLLLVANLETGRSYWVAFEHVDRP